MSRGNAARSRGVLAACGAVQQHLRRGPENDPLSDGLVFDAVRVRLIEIGEAVRDLGDTVREAEPGIPWRQIAGLRDRLAHRYFDTTHGIIAATARGRASGTGSPPGSRASSGCVGSRSRPVMSHSLRLVPGPRSALSASYRKVTLQSQSRCPWAGSARPVGHGHLDRAGLPAAHDLQP